MEEEEEDDVFQDLGSQFWGLGNFKIWFSGLGMSTLGPGKFYLIY